MSLIHSGLLRNQLFIDGHWRDASTGDLFSVVNPASGGQIAQVADANSVDAELAIQAAAVAQPEWAATTAKERSRLLRWNYWRNY
jgi:succinate-semialdehyde dehydrogenase / glutarate-semialdehyde dehydrogenase